MDFDPEASPTAAHRKAVQTVNRAITEVLSAPTNQKAARMGFAVAAVRLAAFHDEKPLAERDRDALISALGAAHDALIKLASDASQAASVTLGNNAIATLIQSWAGDARWTRGSGPYLVAQKIAVAFQLELTATAILDEVADEHEHLQAERGQILARLLRAGTKEN